MTQRKQSRQQSRKPRILVLEALRDAAACVRAAGGEPIVVNPRHAAAVEEALSLNFDAVLLTGGGDVNPATYGAEPHAKVYGVNDVRDLVEWMILDHAAMTEIPVLGICRGMQLMAVHNGGKLKQHVEGHRNTSHLVVAERGSTFRRVVGQAGVFVSLHHQRVLRTGRGWRVGGRDPRGGIEAVESRDGRCLGVQFHPEMDHWRNEQSRKLFRWLVIEAARRAGLPVPRASRRPSRTSQTFAPVRRVSPLDQLQLPRPKPRPRSLETRWFCRDCGIEFDKQQDRDDHEYWICGTPTLRTMEPPPGHHDWLPLSRRSPEENR
jgi:putative glutamine amidotransferase